MNKRIAFDFDGVIADTNQIKSEWISKHLGLSVPKCKCDRTNCISIIGEKHYEKMTIYLHRREMTIQTNPVNGSLPNILSLSQNNQLYVITNRTPERIEWIKEWMEKFNIASKIKNIYRSHNSFKLKIADALSIYALLDDDIRHLKTNSKSEVIKYLFSPNIDQLLEKEGIFYTPSWASFVNHLKSTR
jgi:hypothetical protein